MEKSDLIDGRMVRLVHRKSGEEFVVPVKRDGNDEWIFAGEGCAFTLWSPALARAGYGRRSGWNPNYDIELVQE